MELTNEILEQLRKPFPAREISFKCQTKPNEKGNALVVAYIDARNVMERLDKVAGPDWSDRYEKAGTAKGLVCYLTVCGVTRADVGDDDNENEPVKSAYSDAFKRAAVKFGIGRFLYDLPKMWGKARPLGKSFILEDGELERLQRVVDDSMNGKPQQKQPAKAEKKPEAPKQDAPKQEAGLADANKRHGAAWTQASKLNLITKENAKAWSISPNTPLDEVERKIEAIMSAVAEAK